MNFNDFKLYAINTTTLGVTTFTEIEMGLKLLLLVVTIGYTINKIMRGQTYTDKVLITSVYNVNKDKNR